MELTFILLFVYQVKHFLADFPLQGKYMLGKFLRKGWVKPLAAHSAVHSLFTLAIVGMTTFNVPLAIGLALMDGAIHFIIDRIKASPKLLGRFKSATKEDYECYKLEIDLLDSAFKRKAINEEIYNRKKNKKMDEFKDIEKNNRYFWWSLGGDQLLHHCTHYVIIVLTLHYR